MCPELFLGVYYPYSGQKVVISSKNKDMEM